MCDTCGCGHDHEHGHDEMEMETIRLTLEDDSELECGILGTFDVEGMGERTFIALLPLEDETVLLYEYEEIGEEIKLSVIEDDDEFEKVSDTFYELFDGEEEEE